MAGHCLILQCVTVAFPQAPYPPQLDPLDRSLDRSPSSRIRIGILR